MRMSRQLRSEGGTWQTRFTHALTPQSAAQAPQLRGSKLRSVHRPAQAVRPLAQLGARAPLVHTWPAGHAAPHAPQCRGSVCASVHRAGSPHTRSGAALSVCAARLGGRGRGATLRRVTEPCSAIRRGFASLLVCAAAACASATAEAQPRAPSSEAADSLAPTTEGDQDRDGVPDIVDQCPSEPEAYNGVQDDDGCPDVTVEDVATRGPIRAVVPLVGRRRRVAPEVTLVLDFVVRLLRRHPRITELTVEGHTDAQGADAWNLLVSRARADFVRDQLIARGLAPERVVSLGLGERCPAVAGVGPAVSQRNRRVRFVITRSTDPRWPAETAGCAASRALEGAGAR